MKLTRRILGLTVIVGCVGGLLQLIVFRDIPVAMIEAGLAFTAFSLLKVIENGNDVHF